MWSMICDDIDSTIMIMPWLKSQLKNHVVDYLRTKFPLTQKTLNCYRVYIHVPSYARHLKA